MMQGQRLSGESYNPRAFSLRQHARHHRHLQQRARRNRHTAVRGKFLLIECEEAAGRGDAVDTVRNQFVGSVSEELKQIAVIDRVHDLVGHSTAHNFVLHWKRPSLCVADVAIKALELAVEHQNADRHAIVGALMLFGSHGRAASASRERIAAEASAASNSPVKRSSSG